jgi:inner membrane protein
MWMPGGKTHLAIGVGTALALGSVLPLDEDFWWKLAATVGVCSVAALAPDLDIDDNELEEMSRDRAWSVARHLKHVARNSDSLDRVVATGVGAVLVLLGELVSRVLETLAWLIQRVTTHRGMTHSLLCALFTTSLALYASYSYVRGDIWWGLAWGVGYLSHLIADSWTWSGVRFLLPFSNRHFWLVPRLLRFRVGTWRDTLLRVVSPFIGAMVLLLQHRVLDRLMQLS